MRLPGDGPRFKGEDDFRLAGDGERRFFDKHGLPLVGEVGEGVRFDARDGRPLVGDDDGIRLDE